MESKEKLLRLINACLENKNFYDKYTSEFLKQKVDQRNSIDLFGSKCYRKHVIDFRQDESVTKSFNMSYAQYDEIFKINENLYKTKEKENNECIKTAGFQVNFNDMPPILVYANLIDVEVENKHININDVESFPIKNFWGKIIRVEERKTGYSVKFLLRVTKELPKFEITSGSIKVEITEDEFNALIEKYKSNKEKFEKEIDEQVIEERLKYYEK